MKKCVLFVCTGNTCRSPLAEAYFNRCAADMALTGYVGCSAGLYADNGSEASTHSRLVAGENDCTLEDFRSRMLTGRMVQEAWLIIGMTDAHCRKIKQAMPECADKVHRLLEFAQDGEVTDPYGGTLEDYRQCFAGMKQALENLAKMIKEEILV